MAIEFELFLNLIRPILIIDFVITLVGLNVKIRGLFWFFFQIAAVFSLLSGLQSIPLWVFFMWLITFSLDLVCFGLFSVSNHTILEVWHYFCNDRGLIIGIILVFCLLRHETTCRRKLFKDQYVLKCERSFGLFQIIMCAFRILLNQAVIVGIFRLLLLLMTVDSLQHIFQGMEALIQDLPALRWDLSLIVAQICLS